MSSVLLWSLSQVTSPVLLADAPHAVVRSVDEEPRQRRSHEDSRGAPPIQMGAGPTAFAMLALVAAVVARSARRRRAGEIASS